MVPASSHKVSRVSWYSGSRRCGSVFAYGAFTLSGWPSQGHSADSATNLRGPKPRGARAPVWALPISLAATLRIDFSFEKCFFFLFLRLLRCFSSPGSLPYTMDSCMGDGGLLRRVPPFRNLRIYGYLLLPEAYRSLSRLSSALSAKASTLRSSSFNLPFTPSVALLGVCLVRFRFPGLSLRFG